VGDYNATFNNLQKSLLTSAPLPFGLFCHALPIFDGKAKDFKVAVWILLSSARLQLQWSTGYKGEEFWNCVPPTAYSVVTVPPCIIFI